MTPNLRNWCLLALAVFVAVGCGKQDGRPAAGTQPSATPSAEGAKYVLAAEPAGARDIIAARKETKDGDALVLVGRIGGRQDALGKSALFTFVDLSLAYCPDDEGCPTPWDYCCVPEADRRAATATVKFEAEPGRTHATDPKQLLGVDNLDVVVVRGKAKRDEAGNLVVVGDGLFIREKHSARKK